MQILDACGISQHIEVLCSNILEYYAHKIAVVNVFSTFMTPFALHTLGTGVVFNIYQVDLGCILHKLQLIKFEDKMNTG